MLSVFKDWFPLCGLWVLSSARKYPPAAQATQVKSFLNIRIMRTLKSTHIILNFQTAHAVGTKKCDITAGRGLPALQ